MSRGRLFVAAAVVIAIAVLVAVGLSGPRRSIRHVPFGFNNNAVSQGIATPAQTAALLRAVGGRIDRVQVEWRRVEPAPGRRDFRIYDAIYKADLADGIRPLFIFAFAPQWAAGPACNAAVSLCPPTANHVAAAASVAAAMARRYPRLAGLEIWNEPNTPYFWYPRADPVAYTRLLRACYKAIKRADAAMPVAGGSVSDSPGFASGYVTQTEFIRDIYRNGGGHSMDAIAIHPYPNPGDVSASTASVAAHQALSARNAAGDHHTPLWVTETGLSTSGPRAVSEAAQAAGLMNLYTVLSEVPDVRMIIFHTLLPPPHAAGREPGYSVFRGDASDKPAACTLSRFFNRRSHC